MLRHLGFDLGFDEALYRTADKIRATDLQEKERLSRALERARSRRSLGALACTAVHLQKRLVDPASLDKDAKARYNDLMALVAQGRARLAEAVTAVAAKHHVRPQDVNLADVAGRLQVEILFWDVATSPLRVLEALAEALAAKDDPSGIHKAFAASGALDDSSAELDIRWPVERAHLEAQMAFPQYEISMEDVEGLRPALVASASAFRQACQGLAERDAASMASLQAKASLAHFSGELLTSEAARSRGLQEDVPRQDARSLRHVMLDAAQAHQSLKSALAPATKWAAGDFSDRNQVPVSDERRKWYQVSPNGLAAAGLLFDPGIKLDQEVFDEAKRLQRPEQAEPPVQDVVDASELEVEFGTPAALLEALGRMEEHWDLAWLDNGFSIPTASGYRDVTLGVRQLVGSRRFVSKVRLTLQTMRDVREGAGGEFPRAVSELCARRGVKKPEHVQRLTDVLTEAFASTHGKALRALGLELRRAAARASEVAASGQDEDRRLAEALADEVGEQARSFGADESFVASTLERVPRLSDEIVFREWGRGCTSLDRILVEFEAVLALAERSCVAKDAEGAAEVQVEGLPAYAGACLGEAQKHGWMPTLLSRHAQYSKRERRLSEKEGEMLAAGHFRREIADFRPKHFQPRLQVLYGRILTVSLSEAVASRSLCDLQRAAELADRVAGAAAADPEVLGEARRCLARLAAEDAFRKALEARDVLGIGEFIAACGRGEVDEAEERQEEALACLAECLPAVLEAVENREARVIPQVVCMLEYADIEVHCELVRGLTSGAEAGTIGAEADWHEGLERAMVVPYIQRMLEAQKSAAVGIALAALHDLAERRMCTPCLLDVPSGEIARVSRWYELYGWDPIVQTLVGILNPEQAEFQELALATLFKLVTTSADCAHTMRCLAEILNPKLQAMLTHKERQIAHNAASLLGKF